MRSFGTLFKQTLGRLSKPARLARGRPRNAAEPDSRLVRLVAAEIEEYAKARATLFERAERLISRAQRLEEEGMPSESARNRARRAKEEVLESLGALRARLAEEKGHEGLLAFDHEIKRRYPALDFRG